jgi:hypothetical protein
MEPRARGILIRGFADAARDLWGEEGLRKTTVRLPADVHAATVDRMVIAVEWVPESYVVAWHNAVLAGPCARDAEELRRWIRHATDLSFGRIRRLFLRIATPDLLMRKAAELWRHDHTTGELVTSRRGATAHAVLRDHPYVRDPVASLVIAEVFRHILALSRLEDVHETHKREGESLVVRLSWRG